jgi:hypothetical protein
LALISSSFFVFTIQFIDGRRNDPTAGTQRPSPTLRHDIPRIDRGLAASRINH